MERKIGKKAHLVFFSILVSIFVISCSMTKDSFISWEKLFKAKEKQSFFSMRSRLGNPDSHYLLACYYQERGRQKEAIEELAKVLSIDPGYVKAYNGMGVSYDLLRDFRKAIESYEKALQLNADLDYVQNNLG